MNERINLLTLVALAWLVMIGVALVNDASPAVVLAAASQTQPRPEPHPQSAQPEILPNDQPAATDPAAFGALYDSFFITQEIHGASYGHMAVDLTGGKDAVIYSPIDGEVSARFTDAYGNTWLILENEVYQVTLLHGLYSVEEGQPVVRGQPVGVESNQGYTLDLYGNLCEGRDCGYHSHLNVFDKRLGANVNPLDLIGE